MIFIVNHYRPNQPIYAIRAGATGDITLKDGKTSNEHVAWSYQRGGAYMPTPVVYGEYLYVCPNNGALRVFNTKPSEDGEIYVVKAGPKYELLATNSMGELIMATPAISDGMIFVRTTRSLYCIAERGAKSQGAR
jgi:hypothetical protein